MKQYCEQHWGVVSFMEAESEVVKEEEEEEEDEDDWMNSTGGGSKRDSPFLLRSWASCYCEGPRCHVAPVSPQGPQSRLSSDDNTCPYYMYITLMLTCNLSAVAAWRHSLCVCTDVATCEFVQYMQVCVCVCLCPQRNLSVVTQRATRACTLWQLHSTHILHTHIHATHRPTHSSSCSPFSTLSWALPDTPHGDFALCQLSYSNKPLRHWPLRCHYWLQCVLLPQLIYIIYL